MATDVLGRVIEVASGLSLADFFARRIFGPLGMTSTSFGVADADRGRLAALYTPGADGTATRLDALAKVAHGTPRMLSGGGGLIGTAGDYQRFTAMLAPLPASPAGELDGVRLLSPRTVAYMTRNQLPGGADLEGYGRPLFAAAPFHGVGFGLGFAVTVDAAAVKTLTSEGEYSWGAPPRPRSGWTRPSSSPPGSSPSCCRPAPTRSAPSCASSSTRQSSISPGAIPPGGGPAGHRRARG